MRGWEEKGGHPTESDLALMATFAASWEQVEEESAQRVFRLAAYCAPNQPIPRELLEGAAGLDTTGCDEALALLTRLGLLAMEDPAAGPTIHPLLAEFGRALPREEAFDPLPALAGALAKLSYKALERGLPARFAPLRPHLEVAAPAAEAAGVEEAATLFNNLGAHLHTVADYVGARAAYERALAIDQRTFGSHHPAVARDVNNLWSVLQDLGDLEGARAAYERALAIDEAVYGPEHLDVARDINNLGSVLADLGDLARARAAFERVLDILAKTLPSEHPHVATTHNNLGSVLQDLGDLAGARAAYQRALAIWQETYGEEHPQVATAHNNLGRVLYDLGDLAGARAAYERALVIFEGFLPTEHPHIALVRENLRSLTK